jgi:hypothetical protein
MKMDVMICIVYVNKGCAYDWKRDRSTLYLSPPNTSLTTRAVVRLQSGFALVIVLASFTYQCSASRCGCCVINQIDIHTSPLFLSQSRPM